MAIELSKAEKNFLLLTLRNSLGENLKNYNDRIGDVGSELYWKILSCDTSQMDQEMDKWGSD